MNEKSQMVNRLIILESHVAHQDTTIDDLSQMVNKQWLEIEKMQRILSDQRAVLTRLESDLKPDQFYEEPPHY